MLSKAYFVVDYANIMLVAHLTEHTQAELKNLSRCGKTKVRINERTQIKNKSRKKAIISNYELKLALSI